MGLQKEINTRFGYPATYWKIEAASVGNKGGESKVAITMHGFKDRAARLDPNSSIMATRNYDAPGSDFVSLDPDRLFEDAYAWVKANVAEFSDAIDVLEVQATP